jgi:hypothetical protein
LTAISGVDEELPSRPQVLMAGVVAGTPSVPVLGKAQSRLMGHKGFLSAVQQKSGDGLHPLQSMLLGFQAYLCELAAQRCIDLHS